MFKKLKHKFIIINMSLLSFVFMSIFTVIYILTAVSGERQLSLNLNKIMKSPPRQFETSPKSPDPHPRPPAGDMAMASSLIVDLDKNGDIIIASSFVTIEEKVIEEAVNKAASSNKIKSNIKAGDLYYTFLKRENPFGIRIVFVDRGPLRDTLRNTLIIFIAVGSINLIILFFISVFLANRTIKPIKEAFEKQQQFVADASHELKTPLTIIKTNLAVISENEDETVKSQSKWLGFINSQTERMSNLINDMLSLAKMDSMKQQLSLQNFNLSKLLDGILLSFEAAIFENNIELKEEIQRNIQFTGNRESLERLINILMDNAVKNTPKGGIISAGLSWDRGTIKIVVKNTGVGIPPEHIDKIFERFYRADSSRAREKGGYGLGLAIANSIVLQHHGKIYAESNVGFDTSFIVELPQGKRIS